MTKDSAAAELVVSDRAELNQSNPTLLYLASLSAGSRPTMISSLRQLAEAFFPGRHFAEVPWHEMDHVHMTMIRTYLAERYAHTTANRVLSGLRGILRHAYRAGMVDSETYMRAREIDPIRGERVPAGRSLSQGELRALFGACDVSTIEGARDAGVLAVLYGCGLRRAEVCGLSLADWDPGQRALRVLGKGNKERLVYPPAGTVRAIERWLTYRGDWRGPLFVPLEASQRMIRRRYSTSAVDKLTKRVAKRAQVGHFVPHDMRRTFVGDMLDADVDLSTVQKLAGHSSPTTTARYDRRPERAKALAAERLHVPFGGDDD